jgi:hypothetical protein
LNPFVVTLRRGPAARICAPMIDRPGLRELGKSAEKWRDLAERRRDYFSELYRSGRWRLYYDLDDCLALVREAEGIYDRWMKVVEQHRRAQRDLEAPTIDRDAA